MIGHGHVEIGAIHEIHLPYYIKKLMTLNGLINYFIIIVVVGNVPVERIVQNNLVRKLFIEFAESSELQLDLFLFFDHRFVIAGLLQFRVAILQGLDLLLDLFIEVALQLVDIKVIIVLRNLGDDWLD